MSRYFSYLYTAKEILLAYHGSGPFALFIKKKFSLDKKFGSRDRKEISHLCYCFFRLGKMPVPQDITERILTALFLCSHSSNEILNTAMPAWNKDVGLTVQEKIDAYKFSPTKDIFPWRNQLSHDIDEEKFAASLLIQPDMFLRLRPGHESDVKEKLARAGIVFSTYTPSCLALSNTTKVDEVLQLNREAVVQDFNSQQVANYLDFLTAEKSFDVWDCCAASGGKSIMAFDLNASINLTVSDIRENILINLRKRFEEAGIKTYRSFIADLSSDNKLSQAGNYQLIIADIPCTGSGTWGRTPEQLYFFEEKRIDDYVTLQRKILNNIMNRLVPGGYLLYITCSVFKKENEETVDFLEMNFPLQKIKAGLLKGYDQKADTLFAALLQKEL